MYIREVYIENIRSISKFDMKFREGEEAGWHVLIGDNGSGKTTILRSLGIGLIGIKEIVAFRLNLNDWVKKGFKKAKISIQLTWDVHSDKKAYPGRETENPLDFTYTLSRDKIEMGGNEHLNSYFFKTKEHGWFSSGFGPIRKFTGDNDRWKEVFENPTLSRLGAHLSLFNQDVALTEIVSWLKKLKFQLLEEKTEGVTLEYLKTLINDGDFLPNGGRFDSVDSDGVYFTDVNGDQIDINQLSNGYQSVISLSFELIRQMILSYGADKVFENIRKGEMNIPLPGVVLIDEIDAHLHPTWQTRIGQWFTKYFPKLQFIVTTHSPLVCRACEKGTIWRLAAPGSNQESKEIIGVDRDKLIYGNVLDAYGTKVFGKDVSISEDANDKLNRLGELNIKSIMGEPMTPEEEAEYYELKSIFPTQQTK